MFDDIANEPLTDDYVINRMFDLVRSGQTGTDEYAMLDAVIVARMAGCYQADAQDAAPRSRTADA